MEGGTKLTSGVRKAKKKQVKDEFDRIKQAEKKRRRLEKALAASAAMRSELEKKKQKKKEEQDRLDKEGAAIAEAVAMHVLIDEDSGDIIYDKDEELASLECASNIGSIIVGGRQSSRPYHDLSNYTLGNIEWVPNGNGYEHAWNHRGNSNFMVSYNLLGGELCPQYFGEGELGTVGLSPGHLAAQAVSSLKIGDETRMDAYLFNPMLRG